MLQVAQDVPPELLGSPWLLGLVEQMTAVMRAAPGVGLAAPQIGQPWKVRPARGQSGTVNLLLNTGRVSSCGTAGSWMAARILHTRRQ